MEGVLAWMEKQQEGGKGDLGRCHPIINPRRKRTEYNVVYKDVNIPIHTRIIFFAVSHKSILQMVRELDCFLLFQQEEINDAVSIWCGPIFIFASKPVRRNVQKFNFFTNKFGKIFEHPSVLVVLLPSSISDSVVDIMIIE